MQPIPPFGKGSPKILCMSYTFDKKHHKAAAQAKSWMHKCDTYFFASNKVYFKCFPTRISIHLSFCKENKTFNAIHMKQPGGERYKNMWNKVPVKIQRKGVPIWKFSQASLCILNLGPDDVAVCA